MSLTIITNEECFDSDINATGDCHLHGSPSVQLSIRLMPYSTRPVVTLHLRWYGPPGHHAERDLAMGFCYLSNIALAAIYDRDHGVELRPGQRNRVVVIDIDHHRGNGTADILASKADTLFIDVFYCSPYDERRKRFTDGLYDAARDRSQQAGREYPCSRPGQDWGLEAHPMAIAPNIVSIDLRANRHRKRLWSDFLLRYFPK